MKVVAAVPAKGVSERVENKNLAILDGEPLVRRALRTLLKCKSITEVWLDTESPEIVQAAQGLPVQILNRDPSLATNNTDGHALFYNEVVSIAADIHVQVLCTCPFLRAETIDHAVSTVASGKFDSCVAVRSVKSYMWRQGAPTYGMGRVPNSVSLPDNLQECMSLYVVERKTALRTRRRFGDNVFLLEVDSAEAIDIDTPSDLAFARTFATGRAVAESNLRRALKSSLSTALLSDCMDDLGIHGFAPGLSSPIRSAKVFGRAATLRLRRLHEDESSDGIYDALGSYDRVGPGDVIVVENPVEGAAYFGALNARLSIRRGAEGAIIEGATRDGHDVANLGFPVFSRSRVGRDVRGRGTVAEIGGTVTIGGLKVAPRQLVFADAEGVCIIPEERADEIVALAVSRLAGESRVVCGILSGNAISEILGDNGPF